MKRSTLSLALSAAILLIGGSLLWFLLIAPRPAHQPTVQAPPPAPPPAAEWHGALNLYLGSPDKLPSGVSRAELTLIKATLMDDKGVETQVFDGVQRVMLQDGFAEKVMSELVPNGPFAGLKLEFSPAAELSMTDGSVIAAVMERRETTLAFKADVPVSRSLALFARLPLEPTLKKTGDVWTANIAQAPAAADSYVFGSFMLDKRGNSQLWTLSRMTLADVIMADLGLDITKAMPGSAGFNPAAGQPIAKPPL